MKTVMLVGVLLILLGIAGTIWGVVAMVNDHDGIVLGGGSTIVLDDGDFPVVGVAGFIVGGIGLIVLASAGIAARRSK